MQQQNHQQDQHIADITIMILFIGLKSVFFHIPMFVSRFYFIFPVLIESRAYYIVALMLFHFSYALNFLIYLMFNRKFRSIFFSLAYKPLETLNIFRRN